MSNPVLVEVTRGKLVESRHRGAVAVADADGAIVLGLGDVATPIFPRSAIKAVQALVLVESGGADRFGFGDEELALACASHGGEPGHVATVERMLAAAGLDASALACGAHWPLHQPSARALARAGGTASALHNNCSGKHAGFLCAACAMTADTRGYEAADHPIQRAVKAALEDLTGAAISDEHRAIDGCAVPTWALPLAGLARAFARFGTGQGLAAGRAAAAARLRRACAAKPWFVAGSGRFCTELMAHFGERVFVKTGAEGVFCGALPEQGLGIAVKCDDGQGRAAEVATAAVIAGLLPLREHDGDFLARFVRPQLRNWNGTVVGGLRPTEMLGGP
ncbi:MAG TPA: asparaginase [Xanthobacteraceae bacterium]|jgi:L-asparaginase II|nr:asparaginase [Xanthobacteraceae bacterium]